LKKLANSDSLLKTPPIVFDESSVDDSSEEELEEQIYP